MEMLRNFPGKVCILYRTNLNRIPNLPIKPLHFEKLMPQVHFEKLMYNNELRTST